MKYLRYLSRRVSEAVFFAFMGFGGGFLLVESVALSTNLLHLKDYSGLAGVILGGLMAPLIVVQRLINPAFWEDQSARHRFNLRRRLRSERRASRLNRQWFNWR